MKCLVISLLTVAMFAAASISAMGDTITYDGSLASPGFYNGTGNPNSGFTIDTNGNLELGLGANLRFVGPIDPSPTNSNIYSAPIGGDPSHSNDAYWDFEFSVNTQAGGGTNTLSDYTFMLTILDVGTSTSNSFDPEAIPDNSYYGTGGKTVGSPPPVGAYGMQNAENLSFAGFLPGFNPNANDTYDFTLTAYSGVDLIASNEIIVNVGTGAVPEPSQLGFLAVGLLGIATMGWRRKKEAARTT
ncbi:MAG TPA: PEP-CTERM sorting domain-containing protein [Bryobacteraceae bacterium]|nr:PEP-CTERM sorting domain-containing protein [Bryobacteraceae bacterium]